MGGLQYHRGETPVPPRGNSSFTTVVLESRLRGLKTEPHRKTTTRMKKLLFSLLLFSLATAVKGQDSLVYSIIKEAILEDSLAREEMRFNRDGILMPVRGLIQTFTHRDFNNLPGPFRESGSATRWGDYGLALSPLAAKQNGELTSKYNVRVFPTTVIVRPSGEEVKRFGGYQRSGVDGFLKALDEVADAAGVKGVVEISDEEAKKDDRFFFASADKGKIASRESKKRKANAQSDFELDEFAGIKFGRAKAEGAPKLEKPYRLLSAVSKTSYAGNKLTGFTLAADASTVKAMTDEALQIETCKLVRALEGELGVQFAVTSSKIDFTGKKTSVVVHSSKASGVLSVQFSRK